MLLTKEKLGLSKVLTAYEKAEKPLELWEVVVSYNSVIGAQVRLD